MSIKSLFVPTPEVEQFSNYYVVQLLAKERIRCIMTGDKFQDTSLELVQKYLTIPPNTLGANAEEKFFKAEAKNVMESFKLLEKVPAFAEALQLVKTYAGNDFEVTSVTANGIQLLFNVPDVSAA